MVRGQFSTGHLKVTSRALRQGGRAGVERAGLCGRRERFLRELRHAGARFDLGAAHPIRRAARHSGRQGADQGAGADRRPRRRPALGRDAVDRRLSAARSVHRARAPSRRPRRGPGQRRAGASSSTSNPAPRRRSSARRCTAAWRRATSRSRERSASASAPWIGERCWPISATSRRPWTCRTRPGEILGFFPDTLYRRAVADALAERLQRALERGATTSSRRPSWRCTTARCRGAAWTTWAPCRPASSLIFTLVMSHRVVECGVDWQPETVRRDRSAPGVRRGQGAPLSRHDCRVVGDRACRLRRGHDAGAGAGLLAAVARVSTSARSCRTRR